MLRPSKWHPKVGEEFWSADITIIGDRALYNAHKHTLNPKDGNAWTLVGFDNCYKSEIQALNQAEYLIEKLGI